MTRSLRVAVRFEFLFVLLVSTPLLAQPVPSKAPGSTHIFPAGAQRGTTVQVAVGAECIAPNSHFYLHGRGVSSTEILSKLRPDNSEPSPRREPREIPITYPKQWAASITVDANCPDEVVYWHLHSAQGGTPTRPFVIGDLPEFIESESNSRPELAEPIKLPLTVNGQVYGERDMDYFRFEATKGELITCEVVSRRLGSRLEPIVEFLRFHSQSKSTTVVSSSQQFVGSDPVLTLVAPEAGTYLIRIGNVSFHGDAAHVYRLNLTNKPFALASYPSVVPSGANVIDVVQAGDQLKSKSSTLANLSSGFSNRLKISTVPYPVAIETEPNNTKAQATELKPGSAICGRIDKAGDTDWFRVSIDKSQTFDLSLTVDQAASLTLPRFEIRDAKGNSILKSTAKQRKLRSQRVVWRAKPGDYRIRIRDLRHGSQGSVLHIYRFTLLPSKPDFQLELANDGTNAVQGGTLKLPVTITRYGGFAGEVKLNLTGLPPNCTVSKAIIPKGATKADVELKFSKDTPSQAYSLHLTGTARLSDGATIVRTARARHLGIDDEGVAYGDSTREWYQLALCHIPRFRLYCSEAYLYAHRGSVFPYPMEIERLDGFDKPISLQISDRQNRDVDGIEMWKVTFKPGQTDAYLPIYLPETMHINVQSQSQLYCQGFSKFRDKFGRMQHLLVVSEKRNMLRTLPPVVKLNALTPQLAGSPGEKVTAKLFLDRTSNFPAGMTLTLHESSDPSFQFTPVKIAPNQTNISIPLTVTSAPLSLTLRATGFLPSDDSIKIVTEARLRIKPVSNSLLTK